MRVKALFAALFLLAGSARAGEEWERFPDGSTGRSEEFQGVGGVAIPAYLRRPGGPGPFPVVVMLHGGRYGKAATIGMGRSTRSPVADFIKEGWAVYSVDYRPTETMLEPVEIDDTIEAVKAVRKKPFIDPNRVGFMGGSHGANVASRLISRVDASGAILCAPAALDLVEVKKAPGRGEPIVPILRKLIADMEEKLGAPAEEVEKDPAKYGYRSAFTEASQARCPVLIINGRNDDNSPPSVIEAYVNRLRAAGKPVETYLPANGPHGFYFGRPDIPEWKESTRRAVAFFRRCFAPGAGASQTTGGQDGAAARSDTELAKKAGEWVASLKLDDPAREARLKEVVATHLKAVRDWHNAHPFTTVPAGINPATGNRLTDLDRQVIADSAIPASVHEELMAGLRKDLSPEQVEAVLDRYTVGKVAFTMKAYHAIVTDLTPEEEAAILAFLKQAREQAVDYKNMNEISAIFEVYKTRSEQSLNANGRNWKALYKSYSDAVRARKAGRTAPDR